MDLHRVARRLGVAERLVGVECLLDLGVGLALAKRLVEAVSWSLLTGVLDALRATNERRRVALGHELTGGVARVRADDHRDSGGALAHPDRHRGRRELHAGLDRPVKAEVLLAVEDRAEQLGRDHRQGGHAHRLEGGHDREHRRREVAGRVRADVVVGGGGVGGDALALDRELHGLPGGHRPRRP